MGLTGLGVSDFSVGGEGRVCLLPDHMFQEFGKRLVLLPGLGED